VSLPKDKLCILTPDNFYGVMLQDAAFPTFDVKVIKGAEQLQSLAVNFFPDAFLLFSEHLGPTVFAKTLLDIRFHYPKAAIFQIEGVREPRLQMICSARLKPARSMDPIPVTNVSDIDSAIQQLRTESTDKLKKLSLTNAQIEVLRLLAEGRSIQEIAQARNTSVRAVETLLNRSLLRVTAELPSSARAKMALAQRYLGWKP
jgi:hypothetical protein